MIVMLQLTEDMIVEYYADDMWMTLVSCSDGIWFGYNETSRETKWVEFNVEENQVVSFLLLS